ncbi:MAG: hypothetical protein IT436_00435 [Phycisphaerales bacterium]|nr:hypothetical protein [Phycisphaerales bacterium]
MRTINRVRAFATGSCLLLTLAGPARAEPCGPADLNGDGFVDFVDYLVFLNLYEAGDPQVDFTGDGLVDFSDYLEFLNLYEAGCLPACEPAAALAAVPLPTYPYANFVDAFLDTSPVTVAVDPARHPDLSGRATRIYITANRTWADGDALVDVRGASQAFTWPGGTLPANLIPLTGSTGLPADAGEDIGIGYDIVIDVNADGVFDLCDLVDGAGPEAGFYKFKDLSTVNPATAVTQIGTLSVPIGRTAAGFEDERWYYPTDIASRGQIPIVFIGHGAGHQYTWYDHLGLHLASYGMIVISFENNVGAITSTAKCTLDHVNTVIALQSTLGGGILNGHIDQSEIYLIGHSRGGEGVAYAWPLLDTTYAPTGGFPRVISSADIKYVQSIAPVNDLDTLTPPSGAMTADFMLLYGGADGDVCGCPAFELSWSFPVFERALARRNSVYIQGADHNVFNCCGFRDFTGPAGTETGRPESQKLQKALTLASIKYYRDGNIPAGEVLWRQYETFKPGATLATAVVDYEYRDSGPGRRFIIDDYQANFDFATSSSGGAVAFTITNLNEGLMRDPDTYTWSPSDPMNGMSRSHATGDAFCAVFDYDPAVPSRHYTFDVVPAGRDTTPYTFLSFRACQQTRHPYTTASLSDQVFDVELEDSAGQTSRIRINAYGGGIEEVYQRSGGWQNEFETIRIRLSDFTADGRALDLSDIVKVRFLFGSAHGSDQGRLGLDDIEFVK